MTPDPFLPDWNFQVLKELFLRFPHGGVRDAMAQFFTANALASTWIYAAVFYIYWRIEDDRTIWRRTRLFEIFVAFCLATLATLLFRPWVGWPAPTLVPRFQQLYPKSFWNGGNPNCFPSHSTLTYLLVAAGFWSFRRWLSFVLIVWVFLLISMPRIYVGGHYPVDVIAAILLAAAAAWAARLICARPRVAVLLTRTVSKGLPVEAFLFLWLFELGNGFGSSYWILRNLLRAARNIWH
jgi:membrane-associated phospholipid phosphatase